MGLVMRRLVVAVALIGIATGALAADYETDFPTLRGSTPYIPAPPRHLNWEGVYGGGQVGYGMTHMDFSKVVITPFDPNDAFTAPLRSSWPSLGTDNARAPSYGAFIGYNWQFDELIVGFEANYSHTKLFGSATGTKCYNTPAVIGCNPAITLGDGNSYNAVVTTTASMRITDYGTARLRAGWVNDNWLPYAMVGLAVGRVEISKYATATGTPVSPPGTGTPFTSTEGIVNSPMLAWGYSAGVGVDYMLFSNVFLRAEYEFVSFFLVSDVRSQIHSGHVGVGVKF